MTPEELRALLEKAVKDIELQQKANDALTLKIQSLESKIEDGDTGATEQEIEDIKNEISDLRSKYKSPIAVTGEDSKKAIRNLAGKAFNQYARQAKGGEIDMDKFLSKFVPDQVKALNITDPEMGGSAVASILSMDLIEYAREYSPILSWLGTKEGMSRDFTQLVLVSYPSVGDGIENVAGVELAKTTEQKYLPVKSDVIKVYANPRLTDEAMMGTDYDVYADLIRLIGQEISIKIAYKVYYGDGGDKNGRGLLSSSRIDITEGTGKSFKPTLAPDMANARGADYLPVVPTLVDGALGADNDSIVDFLIDLTNTLPTMYLKDAAFHFNRKTKSVIEKLKDADGKPIFRQDYMIGGLPTIKDFPVRIDDTLPDIESNSTPIIFGDISKVMAMSNGDIDYMQANPYKVQGQTILEYNKEVFTIIQASDAVLVVACTTNKGA